MQQPIQIIKDHLMEHEKHYIQVFNALTEEAVHKALYLDEIKQKYGSIDAYFSHLLRKGLNKLQIVRRRKQGVTSMPVGIALPLSLSNASEQQSPLQQHGLSGPAMSNQHQMNAMPSVQSLTQEILYKQRIQDLEERILDLKSRLGEQDEENRTIKRQLQDAYDEIRKLKVSVETAEREKELALKEQELNQRSFFDSEFAKDGLKGIFDFAGGHVQDEPAQLAGPGLSDTKRNLVSWISSASVSEGACHLLSQVATQIAKNGDPFVQKLRALIKEFETQPKENAGT